MDSRHDDRRCERPTEYFLVDDTNHISLLNFVSEGHFRQNTKSLRQRGAFSFPRWRFGLVNQQPVLRFIRTTGWQRCQPVSKPKAKRCISIPSLDTLRSLRPAGFRSYFFFTTNWTGRVVSPSTLLARK